MSSANLDRACRHDPPGAHLTSTKAILIPADAPPSQSSIKRQLLFFDSLLVPLPEDAALLNKNEIQEVFPDGYRLQWGEIGPYPRSLSYVDQHRLLRAQAEPATRSGKLQFVDLGARSAPDATQNWVAAVAALKTESLVRAALPDHNPGSPPTMLNSNSGYNVIVPSRTGYESKYHWLTQLDAQAALPVDELWRRVAMGRLGRAMKVVRRASADGAIPLALDPTNQNICLALGAQAYGDLPTPQYLSSAAVALDTVDPVALDAALDTMDWADVLRVRKEILPSVSKLRGLLVASVRAAARPQNSGIEPYLAALGQLKEDYRRAEDDARSAWTKVGFRVLEASAAAGLTGLTAIAPSATWATVFTSIAIATVVKAIGGTGADVHTILRAGKKQKASPLFAFDGLVALGNAELKITKTQLDQGASGARPT